jgi:hypothetical protein
MSCFGFLREGSAFEIVLCEREELLFNAAGVECKFAGDDADFSVAMSGSAASKEAPALGFGLCGRVSSLVHVLVATYVSSTLSFAADAARS